MKSNRIPIFYACDDNFVKYTLVSIHSLMQNASKSIRYHYIIYILNNGISKEQAAKILKLKNLQFEFHFVDVGEHLNRLTANLPVRDYYSKTTYYRLFIPDMFPQYDKAIYLDSDTIVQGDVSKLFEHDVSDCYLGACSEQAMVQTETYGDYVEQVVGVSRYNFFNAGVLLLNCKSCREKNLLGKFSEHLETYNFVVTQDEDYLNLICKDHVYWLNQRWNTEVYGDIPYPIEEAHVLHYIMVNKPWHYKDCLHGDIFWAYAKKTSVYPEILADLESYTDEQRTRDEMSMENLLALAKAEMSRSDNYQRLLNTSIRARDRVAILEKIAQFEREGRFSEDVEDDPPSRTLMPDEIEYGRKGLIKKAKSRMAFAMARRFVNSLIEDKKMIIKEIRGLENFHNLDCGAIITCNHFNAFDSFAMQIAYEQADQPNREFYRVIREGNYTSFPGFYGFLMRNCNTLPLSSNMHTMMKFIDAVDRLLKEGNFVLIYPEQSMWWNYRKPKPLQEGAYIFAFRNSVPVLPCFITMRDSDILGDDGFYIQEYTIHIDKPIYPDKTLPYKAGVKDLMTRNFEVWKQIYEQEYHMPLVYETEDLEGARDR